MSNPLDFFAIVGPDHNSTEILRVELEGGMQEALSATFRAHANALMSDDRQTVPFDGRYSVGRDELFFIKRFPLPQSLLNASDDARQPSPFVLSNVAVGDVRGIVGLEVDPSSNQLIAIFQEFRQTRLLIKSSTWTFLQNRNAFVRMEQDAFTLANCCDAVFKDGKLYFRSYWATNRFLDLSNYFRDATDREIDSLLKHARLFGDLTAIVGIADSVVRRKFNIIESTKILEKMTPRKIKAIAKTQKFPIELNVVRKNGSEALALPTSKKELKDVLTFLSEGIYVGPLSGEVMRSNSHRPLKQQAAVKPSSRRRSGRRSS